VEMGRSACIIAIWEKGAGRPHWLTHWPPG
jgi:hypothetical protein